MIEFGDHPSALFTGVHREPDIAGTIAPGGTLAAQGLESTYPAFVAGAPRLDALADPDLFLCERLVEPRIRLLLGLELFCLAPQVITESPRIAG